MVGKQKVDWHWADEQLETPRAEKPNSKLREAGKWALFFVDEAVLILILAYIVYRLFM